MIRFDEVGSAVRLQQASYLNNDVQVCENVIKAEAPISRTLSK